MFDCISCNIKCTSVGNFKAHILTKKHKTNFLAHQANQPNITGEIIITNPETKSKKTKTKSEKDKQSVINNIDSPQIIETQNVDIKKFCKYCKKQFYSKFCVDRHLKTCKVGNTQKVLNNLIATIVPEPTEEYKILSKENIFSYVYLLAKFDLNRNRLIYKFGKTKRYFPDRLKEHGKETQMLFVADVRNCDITETYVLKILSNTVGISKCIDIGNEYFVCDDKYYLLDIVKTATINSDKLSYHIIQNGELINITEIKI